MVVIKIVAVIDRFSASKGPKKVAAGRDTEVAVSRFGCIYARALKERAPKSGAPGARSYFEERSLERAPFENTGAEAGARSYF